MNQENPEAASNSLPVIKAVWDSYKNYTPIQLSNATHKPGSPWHDVFQKEWKGDPPAGTDIPIKSIRDHYEKLANPSVQ